MYKARQGRPWFRHHPSVADAVAAATKAADTARERTGRCLPAARLERLREQAVARTEQTGSAPWTDRLPELAPCPPDGDTAGTVIA
ncbi:hypothetical protein [Streptomyces sp. NPDC018347]|uniref:hypothetical protein n=1 Tax=Streptomyces sp. NPDC018347 TaxID=3157193 RepID=UPI0033FD7734